MLMDSVVIYNGFCGYIPRILWLLLSTCNLRDASASKKLRLILKGVRISMSAMQIIFTSTGWNIAAITQHAGVNQLSRARLFSIVLGILGFGVFGNFGLI